MSDIFLSYDSRDLERIKPVAAALRSQGWTVFYDRTIPPGKTWRQFIGKEIDECRCMVVAWSNFSIHSNWVCEEADDGLKRNILVPFLLEPVMPPLGFRLIQAANLVDWQGDHNEPGFVALCAAITELIGAKNTAASPNQDKNPQPSHSKPNSAKVVESHQEKPADKKEPKAENRASKKPAEPKRDKSAQGFSPDDLKAQPPKPPKTGLKIGLAAASIAFAAAGVIIYQSGPPNSDPAPNYPARDLRGSSEPVSISTPEMVAIPAGGFWMGSADDEKQAEDDEKPRHKVRINAFSLGKYEVTFDEYDQFALATKRKLPDDNNWGRGKRPVIKVSWQDATDYAAWLSERTGKHYRLPTEAEWEYAARAGSTGDYFWGDADVRQYAWFSKNSAGKTQQVDDARIKPNAFGLFHMAGNVYEWVEDCYADNYDQAPKNGSAWESTECSQRVLRGGSWDIDPGSLRSADRTSYDADYRYSIVGFRLAQD